MYFIQMDKLPYPCDLRLLISHCLSHSIAGSHIPVSNIVACVFNHQSNVVVLCELDSSCDVLRSGCVDSIRWEVAEIALRIVLEAERCVDRGASFDERVAVSSCELCQPSAVRPVERNVLALLTVVTDTLVAWFGNGLVADQCPSNG